MYNIDTQNNSFLSARDPSILAWNRPALNSEIRIALSTELNESIPSTNEPSATSEHIQVYLRIKPSKNLDELYEIQDNKSVFCRVPDGSQALRNMREGNKILNKYSFSKIYGSETCQNEIFNDCVKDKVLGFINGRNCTLFTYGASGSGKTFTILGESNNPGIIPRSLEYIFRTLPIITDLPTVKPLSNGSVIILDKAAAKVESSLKHNILNSSAAVDKMMHVKTYKAMQQRLSSDSVALLVENISNVSLGIWVSFAEIYNEYVYDLLQPELQRGTFRTKLPLGLDSNGNTCIKKLSNINVTSGLEAYEILQYGMHNLIYAGTSINAHSSRSHCIFTIKLVQAVQNSSEVQISHFNFCDLAGSERVKNSCSVGDRLKESNNINTSLHVLGRCIKSIRESQKKNDSRFIPFRESKLTRIFQPALSGQEAIAMIVNINPAKEMFDESQHVLNFSAVAKDVTVEIATKPVKKQLKNRFSQYMQSKSTLPNIEEDNETDILKDQVQELYRKLENQRNAMEEIETITRRTLTAHFEKYIDEQTKSWRKNLEDQKENFVTQYESRIKDTEEYYENLLASEMAKKPRLSNDDDALLYEVHKLKNELVFKTNEYHQVRESLNEARDNNCSLQAENTKLSFQLQTEININQKKMTDLENTLKISQKKATDLQNILIDAEFEYGQLVQERNSIELHLKEQSCELFILRKEISDLNEQLSAQAVETLEKVEYVEQLEEKLNEDVV